MRCHLLRHESGALQTPGESDIVVQGVSHKVQQIEVVPSGIVFELCYSFPRVVSRSNDFSVYLFDPYTIRGVNHLVVRITVLAKAADDDSDSLV